MPLPLQLPTDFASPRSWSEAAERARASPEMVEALDYFRRLLGENWSGWQDQSHLARSFYTSVQGDVREWVRLYRLARVLADVPNLKLLVKDLGNRAWQRHLAAVQALEFCGRVCSRRHPVRLIQRTRAVSPDAQVWFDDRWVTVEFKVLHDPDAQGPWNTFVEALYRGLALRGVHSLDGRFPFEIAFKAPALHYADAIVDAVASLFASQDPAWTELPHGTGRARFIADPAMPGGLRVPVFQHDDLSRILSNLGGRYRDWIRQVQSVDGPTVVVALTQNLLSVPDALAVDQACSVASTLRGTLLQSDVPSALLLHEEPFWPPPSGLVHAGDGWRFALGSADGRYRAALLVSHPAPRVALTRQELESLVGADMLW